MSAAAPLNQFKVPSMIPSLMESLQFDFCIASLLMSIFAITGFMLALPTGFLLQRMGPKTAGITAASCTVIGSVVGALSPNTGVLLVNRVIEEIGRGLIAVVASAIVGIWFPGSHQRMIRDSSGFDHRQSIHT